MPPIDGKHLILYISATTSTLGALLEQNYHDKRDREVYYISRTLVGYEINYSPIEHTFLAMVFPLKSLDITF